MKEGNWGSKIQLFVAIFFVATAFLKLAEKGHFVQVVESSTLVPSEWASAIAFGVIAAEIVVAVALVAKPLRLWGTWGASVLSL